jgi:hypothetical protein
MMQVDIKNIFNIVSQAIIFRKLCEAGGPLTNIVTFIMLFICFCLGKGAKLWLVVKPSIRSFCITHFIFTSTLHFHFGLIEPSASSFFMCECGHRLDAFGTHLTCCPFEG